MSEFRIRTETIKSSEILDYFVENKDDRQIVDRLKSTVPVILVGSRGVGKSFLLRVAEAELKNELESENVLPVYISFTQGALLQLKDENFFYHWMLAKMCSSFVRSLRKTGVHVPRSLIAGKDENQEDSYLAELVNDFENTWKDNSKKLDISELPSVDEFKEAVEDICEESGISSVNFFIDEAAHILRPAQQRQFFNLYRDLNSPFITCNAAVYPGVTSFGDNFQSIHDATFLNLERDVGNADYVDYMRRIVEKQAESKLLRNIAKNMSNFAVLAYAANGNPRVLLKTLTLSPSISSREINKIIKEFYKSDIWEEHTLLSEKYNGFKDLIDWGRDFIEDEVLPELKEKNDNYLLDDKKTSRFFWIQRDAPESVKKSLTLLCYTGIISLHTEAVKATRSLVGTRYSVNVGCLLALESNPVSSGLQVVQNATVKRMTEYGANHSSYASLSSSLTDFDDSRINDALEAQLSKDITYLDLPSWLVTALKGLGLVEIKDILAASEETIQQAYYVGKVRSRYIKNEATSAVFEYLSG